MGGSSSGESRVDLFLKLEQVINVSGRGPPHYCSRLCGYASELWLLPGFFTFQNPKAPRILLEFLIPSAESSQCALQSYSSIVGRGLNSI